MNFTVSLIAIVLGAYIIASPAGAARIWGSEKLEKMDRAQGVVFLRWFRLFGILLCLGGVLSAIDSAGFSKYHH
jgi:hypothetical protein